MGKLNIKEFARKTKKMWKTPPEGRYLNLKEILSFSLSGLGVSFISNIITAFITVTQVPEIYQIDTIHGSLIFIISSVLGLIFQPIYGKMLQKTKTKWGKYKPYILFGAPLIAILAVASCWLPQSFDQTGRTVYAYCIIVPTMFLYYAWFNTFNMMPSVITPVQQERSVAWMPVSLFIGFAPTIVNFIKGYIRSYFLSIGKEYLAFRWLGIISAVLGLILVLMLTQVKERVFEVDEKTVKNKDDVGVWEGIKLVSKNKPLIILTLALICGCLSLVANFTSEIAGKLRYADNPSQGVELFGAFSVIVGFAVTPNSILLPLMTKKFNNKTIYCTWMGINGLSWLILAIIGYGNIPVGMTSAIVITVFRFFATFNAVNMLIPLMLSEVYDYQQWKTGKRLEGFIQGFACTLVNVVTQVAVLGVALIQTAMGFQPKNYFNITEVSPELMERAVNYFDVAAYISAASCLLCCIVMFFYKLDKKTHAKIILDLQEKAVNEDFDVERAALDAEKILRVTKD